ncbi:hypothetical protein C362_06793 [Cryptococcus neoformans Bt1]|nr:hypothetical protein C362_06793 [Cryptococcus neoformans var. grubii Bt1]
MPVTVHPQEDGDCPSFSSAALQILTQDVSSLLSLSLETTASVLHDWFRSSLGIVGFGSDFTPRDRHKPYTEGESGSGLAVVIVGAGEATGQSLTLHLAKSGYTVFPFIPLPSASTSTSASTSSAAYNDNDNDTLNPPTDALSNILLTWSATRKRLCARTPNHPGAVVPIIVDPEGVSGDVEVGDLADVEEEKKKEEGDTHWAEEKETKRERCARFAHAGETVRAYIRENELTLISIICVSHTPAAFAQSPSPSPSPAAAATRATTTTTDLLPQDSLVNTPESTLNLVYRTNVLDPVSVVRELSDVLVSPPPGFGFGRDGDRDGGYGHRGRGKQSQGRVIFINPSPILPGSSPASHVQPPNLTSTSLNSLTSLTTSLCTSTARILRDELSVLGVEVCEVVVGPMWEKPRLARCWGVGVGGEGKKNSFPPARPAPPAPTRLLILSRLWAVDDALLFSSVRRALEDRYPRYRHYAGLSPLVDDLVGAIPGGGVMTGLGRWMVGKILG